ncbi:MAG: hypothetical protein HY779_00550 [Rubrobacteridae bacterium]|nr:hypothetical protein [Rubrobacteridae bacterium]
MKAKSVLFLLFSLSISIAIVTTGCNTDGSSKTINNQSVSENSSVTDGKRQVDEKTSETENSAQDGKSKDNFDWKGLLTKEEAESVLGEPLGSPEYRETKNPLGQRIIFWPVANEMKLSYIQISLITTEAMQQQLRDAGFNAKKQFESEKEVLKTVEEIDGIGDAAYWDSASPLISGLHVLKGDYCFTVMVNSKDKNSQLQAEKDQAVKILERLP